MKRSLLLVLFLFSFEALALKSLTPQVFQANVRPALKGIINDFYQMISQFPDFPKELITLVEQMADLEETKENLKASCPRVLVVQCQAAVDDLRKKVSRIQETGFLLMARQRPATALYMNSLIGMRLTNEFYNELEAFKGKLDNASFLLRAKIKEHNETYHVIKKLGELQTLLSLSVVEFVPFQYKEDFRHFFFNFVHPVEVHITQNKNYEFLNRNVKALNFAVNLLNMNLTKRNKKTPEGMAPYLSVIHNRWNSLLRYYF